MQLLLRRLLPVLTVCLASLCPAAIAAPHVTNGETFNVPIPDGFKEVINHDSPRHFIAHYIPQDQTEENWTDKIIVQVFRGIHMNAPQYMTQMKNRSTANDCLSFGTRDLVTDSHNGYPSARLTLTCSFSSDSSKGSVSMVRVYSGRENFYYVQRAWRGPPFQGPDLPVSNETMQSWAAFLDSVKLCDVNSANHPCGS